MQHIRLLGLWRGRAGILTLLVAIGLAIATTWVAQALLTSQLFARLLAGESPLAGTTAIIIAALVGVLLARPLLVLLRQLVSQWAMTRIKSDLRARAIVAYVRRSTMEPGKGRSGRDHAVVVDGIENLDAYLSGYVPQLVVTGVVTVVAGGVMIGFDPVTGVIAVVATAAFPLLPRLWDRALAARGSDHWDAYQEMHAEFVDSMHGMPTLVAFGQVNHRERELTNASERLLSRTLRQLRLSLVESGLSQFALAAVPALILIVIAVRHADLDAFAVFALVLLSIELVRPLRDLAAQWHAGYLGTYSGPLVMDFLSSDDARRREEPAAMANVDSPLPVQFEHVSARYPGTEEPTLRDVTVRIDAGLTVVVGTTGSGKSTLAAVLVGLLPAESGRILLGHTPVTPGTLSRQVTLVAQDPTLFSATIGEEIVLAMPRPHDATLIHAAAARVGIGRDGDLLTLQTPLGDDGAVLSGGQRQRVAIARGDLQGRRILVLDEATSALDPESEAQIVGAICDARPRDAVVAITHRLSIARRADHVIVVDGGRIVEDGAPSELLERAGAFAALVHAERTAVR